MKGFNFQTLQRLQPEYNELEGKKTGKYVGKKLLTTLTRNDQIRTKPGVRSTNQSFLFLQTKELEH